MRNGSASDPFKSSAGRGAGQGEASLVDLRGEREPEVVAKLVEVLVDERVVENQDAGTVIGSSEIAALRAVGSHPSALALQQLGARLCA